MLCFLVPLVFLGVEGRLTQAQCPKRVAAAVAARLAPRIAAGEQIFVTCNDEQVLVRSERGQRVVMRDGLSDEALISAISVAVADPSSLPVELEPKTALQNMHERNPRDPFAFGLRGEVWIQPLWTIASAPFGRLNLSVGGTVFLSPHWQLGIDLGFTSGLLGPDERSLSPARAWYISAGPNYYFGQATGFFIGPRLLVTIASIGWDTWRDCPTTECSFPNTFGYAIELGYDAGFRFQLGHVALVLTLPKISVGYGWDRPLTVAPAIGSGRWPVAGVSGLTLDVDLHIFRLGVGW